MIEEKYLKVLEQYELVCYDMYRARGAYIVETGNGIKLLRPVTGSENRFNFEAEVTDSLIKTSDIPVDTFIRNRENSIVTKSDEERYILKDWFLGDECNLKQIRDTEKAVRNLARLHNALSQIPKSRFIDIKARVQEPIEIGFQKKYREMKRVRSYLRDKKQRNEFEIIYINMCDTFLEQAAEAADELNCLGTGISQTGEDAIAICHGSYTYHNLIHQSGPAKLACSDNYAIVGFEWASYGRQVIDLYGFMRKTLEKNLWDIELGHNMLKEYNKIKSVTDYEIKLLRLLFLFPEKFWKITNYYYNRKKSWVPVKNLQKLQAVNLQVQGRMKFIQTI